MRLNRLVKMSAIAGLTTIFWSCASTDDNLQRATAQNIGTATLTNDVNVSNVVRKATNVSWDAKAPSGCYKCDADDMVRRVHCVKVDCATGAPIEKK